MMKLQWPCDIKKYRITQYFGNMPMNWVGDAYRNMGLIGHNGIDFATPMRTKLIAPHDGEILNYGSDTGGRGLKLWNDKDGVMSLFFHLDGYIKKSGDKVKAGEAICLSGNSGKVTTGPHTHFGFYEIDSNRSKKNYNNGYRGAIDPIPYLLDKPKDGTLIKNKFEASVYLVMNGMRWWIQNEETFKNYFGVPVNKAKIEVIDVPTFNSIKWGGKIYDN